MNIKNNQRFRDTEIRMESAMLEIMKDTEFNKITVKKICEKAGVNRSTFYAHFIDIFDMLDKMEMELRKELIESYCDCSEDEHMAFSEKSFIRFLQHIKKYKLFYKVNLNTRKSFPIKQGYEHLLGIIKPYCEKAGITNDDEVMYYFIYFQAGFTMILKHWVDRDCIEEETKLAEIIKNSIPAILSQGKL